MFATGHYVYMYVISGWTIENMQVFIMFIMTRDCGAHFQT